MKRSTPSEASLTAPEPLSQTLRPLTQKELTGVVALWKRGEREIVTRFGGRSMHPTIPEGAAVTLRCGDRTVALDDIVAFQLGDRLIVHRVASLYRTKLFTRGDALVLPDPFLVESSDVIGKVIAVELGTGVSSPQKPARSLVRSSVMRAFALIAKVCGAGVTLRLISVARMTARRFGREDDGGQGADDFRA
jgi:hypothetical protein